MPTLNSDEAPRQPAGFLAKFTPQIEARAHAIIVKMRERLPGATMPIYDNYNALAIGFGPSDRTSDVIFSIAVFPRWVSLFLVGGPQLADPKGLLKGDGSTMRHIVLAGPQSLDDPDVRALMDQAEAFAKTPIDPTAPGGMVIKSTSAKQRPRRPA